MGLQFLSGLHHHLTMNKVLDDNCPNAVLERNSVGRFSQKEEKKGNNLVLPYEGSCFSFMVQAYTADPEE